MTQTYFITGGAGNLACQLSFHLAGRGGRVVLWDVAERPVTAIAAGCEYVRGDINGEGEIARALDHFCPDVVIHFASLLSGKSEESRPTAWRVNMDGAFALMEAAVEHRVGTLFFPSSVAAYGDELPNPLPEDFPQWPGGLYGVTKVAVERLGVYYQRKCGLDFRCIRLPVVVSPHAPPGAASAYASRAFVEAVRNGHFTFNVRPETRPSVIYVKDVLRAIVALLDTSADRLTRRVYNIQSVAPTAAELAEAIARRVPGVKLVFEPDAEVVRMIESWPVEFDDTLARRDWGWRPEYDLDRLADDFIAELQREWSV